MANLTSPSFRNLYAFGKKLPIDLSLSENPFGCSPKVLVALEQLRQKDFFDYPDPDCTELKRVIAKRFGLSLTNIFVSNGSEAIIKLLTQVTLNKSDEVVIPRLTFPMFEIASKMAGGKVMLADMRPDLGINPDAVNAKITPKTKLIFLCNPNNPTGKLLTKQSIIALLRSTKAMVIVDEANIEFGGASVIKEVQCFNNLVVLRTFSKGFGLAGLRIGFCAANKSIIKNLQQTSQPFPVSKLAEKAAIVAFGDKEFIAMTKRKMQEERRFISNELTKRGFEVMTSEANNLLVKIPTHLDDFTQALNNCGVSVVSGKSFNSCGVNFIRVSPRTRKINQQFIQAIDKILG